LLLNFSALLSKSEFKSKAVSISIFSPCSDKLRMNKKGRS
jgi:hypothetical protein